MKRLSTLIWLAIFTAVVPLLALPLWLMKPLIIALALSVAALGYSVFREQEMSDVDVHVETPPTTHSTSEREEGETKETRREESDEPVDITNPDSGRFVATNSYERRRNLHADNA